MYGSWCCARSSNFQYNAHIDDICLKANRLLGMVFKLFSSRSRDFLVRIYLTYIRPRLEYASIIWNPSGVGLSKQLENVQRRFTRKLFGDIQLSYEDRLNSLAIPTLSSRRKSADFIFAFKLLHNLIDIESSSVGVILSANNTRSRGADLVRGSATSHLVEGCYSYRISHMWNDLPLPVKSSISLMSFKKRLLEHLH